MSEIVLSTFNAKYIHTAFGLRYLLANLGELQGRARIVEFDLDTRPADAAETILGLDPKIVGLSVYIWNAREMTALVSVLKRVRPDLTVVLGGPEVSYEWENREIVARADHVISGEADLAFADLCRDILRGSPPSMKVILPPVPDLSEVALPYGFYTGEDVAHRIIYVEASRGCPFGCEFCLSSLGNPVRRFPLKPLLGEFEKLLARGVNHFKFVDRTFNVHLETAQEILAFFLDRYRPGLLLHFEVVPDHFPAPLRDLILRFPPAALQLEVGVQTFNAEVGERIHRRQDYEKTVENLRFLREETGVHIHADLIAGLPGEDLESFASGFDRLVALRPHEIQVGILKRLRGTPISRHDAEWGMVYRAEPPYDLLQNGLIDFSAMQRVKRFARYWDLVSNSGRLQETAPALWSDVESPFSVFMGFSDWLYARIGRHHSIAFDRLAESVFRYLTEELKKPKKAVAETLARDVSRSGRKEVPEFLRSHVRKKEAFRAPRQRGTLSRQARHTSR